MITKISDKGITFIKDFEGVRLKAYKDVKGVLTIGIGHTKGVKAGQTCTVAEAYQWMREDLAPIERYIAKMMPNVRQWHKAAIEALTTIEDVEAYDFTANYPPKPVF